MSDSEDTSDFDEEKQENLIRDFEVEAQMLVDKLLPKKSMEKYELVYKVFLDWYRESKAKVFDESVLIVYFEELSKRYKPSTLWARWSMIKTLLELRHNVQIANYYKLKMFLKNFSKGYKPKQSNTLSWVQVKEFLDTAEDGVYLGMKVILIFGMCGVLRCQEFCNIKMTDVQDNGNHYIVDIRDTKNDYPRSFFIGGLFYDTVKKYAALRPDDFDSDRFFVQYLNGKCTRQVVGKNKIAEVPHTIAARLNVDISELYTGHTFLRTSATLLSDSGGNLIQVKNLGGWKSDAVAQGYIDKSVNTKRKNFEGTISAGQFSSVNTADMAGKSTTVSTLSKKNDLVNNSADESLLQEIQNSSYVQSSKQSVLHYNSPQVSESQIVDSKISAKKRKIDENSLTDIENGVFDYSGTPALLYKCKNVTINTINVNTCSCNHDKKVDLK